MHRQNILGLLGRYQLLRQNEQPMIDRYTQFVRNHDDCFKRTQLSGHVTGSAWLVNRRKTHVLLTHHRKLNMWLQLGGHADGNPDILSVALREAQEESGIANIKPLSDQLLDVDIHTIPARGDEPEHYHYDATFAFCTVDTDEFMVSEESLALEWIEISKITERTTEPSILRMASKWASLS